MRNDDEVESNSTAIFFPVFIGDGDGDVRLTCAKIGLRGSHQLLSPTGQIFLDIVTCLVFVSSCPPKADSYGNEKLTRKWTKTVFFIRDQKFGQSQTHGNGFVSAWFRQLV